MTAIVGACHAFGASNGPHDWLTPGTSTQSVKAVDWLSPSAQRPEWDPYGPGPVPTAGMSVWDPFSPSGYMPLIMEKADPSQEGLVAEGGLRAQNILYIQAGASLVADGRVAIGDTYTLWAYLGRGGSFTLFDYAQPILSQGYLAPGWYRISGSFAEVLGTHDYRFTAWGLPSNNVTVSIVPGGYPTIYALTGRVIDSSGIGIPGVTVTLKGFEGGTFTITTDMLGYYGMDVPSGTYSVIAQLPGYRFTPSTARVWTGTVSAARIIIGLRDTGFTGAAVPQESFAASGWIQGRVLDETGAGLTRAIVGIEETQEYMLTDQSGDYEFSERPGTYTVVAEKSGYIFLPVTASVASGQITEINLNGSPI